MNFQQETSEALTPQQRRAHTNTVWAHMGYACVGEAGMDLRVVWNRQGAGSMRAAAQAAQVRVAHRLVRVGRRLVSRRRGRVAAPG